MTPEQAEAKAREFLRDSGALCFSADRCGGAGAAIFASAGIGCACGRLIGGLAALLAEVAGAGAKDKARLDFLDQANARLNARYGTTYRWRMVMNHNVNRLFLGDLAVDLEDSDANGLPSCRDALDEEMRRVGYKVR